MNVLYVLAESLESERTGPGVDNMSAVRGKVVFICWLVEASSFEEPASILFGAPQVKINQN